MKLDNKEKYERIRKFVTEIKQKANIDPFLVTQEIAKFGIYDFCYINKNPSSFTKIQKKLKDSKYDELAEFIQDIKQIFIAISDYVFEDDPLQAVVQAFKQEIDRFADKFIQDFKTNIVYARPRPQLELPKKPKEEQPPKPARAVVAVSEVQVIRERPSTIRQKLEMLFILRSNENNQAYIRSIGNVYEIGMEVQDEYVITLDNKNTCWMQFLNKQEQ